MRTINIYKFDELSEDAKAVAIHAHRYDVLNINSYDDKESIIAIGKFFELKAVFAPDFKGFEYKDYATYFCEDAVKYINNRWFIKLDNESCPFTGWCLDNIVYDVFDTFRKKIREGELLTNHSFFEMLSEAIKNEWKEAEDYGKQDSVIADYLITNDREFWEDGVDFIR